MQRRSLLKWGVVGTAVLTLMGGGAVLMHDPGWRDGQLTAGGRTVFGAVARAVLDGSLPGDAAGLSAALVAHLDRVESTLAMLPPASQTEISRLLSLLATPPGRLAIAGLSTDWARADVPSLQQALQSMRESRTILRRQTYHALRDLTHAAFFADRSTWRQLGYPGPMSIA
jgi:hypothetical protein